VAPVVIGMILGPMAEQALREALTISEWDWSVFVTRPGSAVIMGVAVLALVIVCARRRQAKFTQMRTARSTATTRMKKAS
jgi:putative tricarboxylic transport membrane protein